MSKGKNSVSRSYILGFFFFLRLFIVFIPQTGYVSTEEFIPGLQTFCARIFKYEQKCQMWGNEGHEERVVEMSSILVDYLFYGWSYHILWVLDQCALKICQTSILTPYILLFTPRMAICLLSFLIDFSLYKLCMISGCKCQSKLLILASSFCMLVYSSRTIVNTKETILFALLLYFVIDSIVSSKMATKSHEHLLKQLSIRKLSSKDMKRLLNHREESSDIAYKHYVPIGILLALGVFNRPTFLLFAATPCAFWLCRGLGHKFSIEGCKLCKFMKRTIALLCVIFPMTLLANGVDFVYNGSTSSSDLRNLNFTTCSKFVMTAVNNIIQQCRIKQEAADFTLDIQIGTTLALAMLLFNVLSYVWHNVLNWKRVSTRKKVSTAQHEVQRFLRMVSMITAGLVLFLTQPTSLDLLPLILPFVYFTAEKIKNSSSKSIDDDSECVEQLHNETVVASKPAASSYNFLFLVWILLNTFLGLFVGFVHEGGVIPATLHMSKTYHADPMDVYIVTHDVSPLPQMLFMQPEHEQEVFLRDYSRMSIRDLIEHLIMLRYEAYVSGNNYQIYLLMPAHKHEELNITLCDFMRLPVQLRKSFYPHFTTDDLPDKDVLMAALKTLAVDIYQGQFANATKLLRTMLPRFQLNLYSIEP